MLKKLLIFISIFLFICFNTKAQQAVLELNANEPAGDYVARDAVVLKPGFSSNQSVFHAYTDQEIVAPVTYNNSSIVNVDERTLDKSLAVGTLPGSLSVGDNGAASYVIPIDLPEGTCSMAPSISLSYNSGGGGSGIMGPGWYISGLSCINRISKNLQDDGIIDPVHYTTADIMALDGNRLINMGSYYRTANETFSKITVLASNSTGPIAFQVETKEGLIIEYGNTTDSRQCSSVISDNVLASYINKVSDRNGNYYLYHYYNNRINGEFRLLSIDYTFNDSEGINAYNSINFIYESKPQQDINTRYFQGSLLKDNVFLKEIRISQDGTVFRKYLLNYSHQSNGNIPVESYLTDIQEFGISDCAYNKTVFNYGVPEANPQLPSGLYCATSWSSSAAIALNSPYVPSPAYGDYDGNGETEIAIFSRVQNSLGNYDYYVQITQYGPVTGPFLENVSDEYPVQFMANPNSYYMAGSQDLNGDGRDDGLFVSNVLGDDDKRILTFIPLISTSNGSARIFYHDPSMDVRIPEVSGNAYIETYLMDMNGDALADLVVRIDENIYIYYTTVSLSPTLSIDVFGQMTTLNLSSASGVLLYPAIFSGTIGSTVDLDLTILDQNGDGINDIIANFLTVSNGFKSYLFLGTSVNGVFSCNGNPLNDDFVFRRLTGDFNSDGNSDVYLPGASEIMFSTGANSSFIAKPLSLPSLIPFPTINGGEYSNYFVGDYNGDGKLDITVSAKHPADAQGLSFGYWSVFYNENFYENIFTNATQDNGLFTSPSGDYRKMLYAIQGDFDGDNVTEIIFDRLLKIGSDYKHVKGYLSANNYFSSKITKISNGLDYRNHIVYRNGGFGVMPAPSWYPNTTQYIPILTVAKVESSDGVGGMFERGYRFLNPKTNLRGKGFLGFSIVMDSVQIGETAPGGSSSFPVFQINKRYYAFDGTYFVPQLLESDVDISVHDCEWGCYNIFRVSQVLYENAIHDYTTDGSHNHFMPYLTEKVDKTWYFSEYSIASNGMDAHYFNNDNTPVQITTTSYTYTDNQGFNGFADGNLASITVSDGSLSNTTTFKNYCIAGSWCANLPQKIENVVLEGEHNATNETTYTYNSTTGKLLSSVNSPGFGVGSEPAVNQSVTHTYTYFNTGKIETETISGSDVAESRIIQYEYDNKFRFCTKVTQPLGLVNSVIYDTRLGKPILETDANGLSSQKFYDGFGTLTIDQSSTGKKVYYGECWLQSVPSSMNENALFYTTLRTDDSYIYYQYFDNMSRLVADKKSVYGNVEVKSNSYYNALGNLVQTRTQGPNTNRLVTENNYDPAGRLVSEKKFSVSVSDPPSLTMMSGTPTIINSLSFDFQDNSLTYVASDNSSAQRIWTKTYNYKGQLIQSKDPGNNAVSYLYDLIGNLAASSTLGASYTTTYDKYGRVIQQSSPNSGISTAKYDAFNQVTETTDGKGNKHVYQYDRLGRVVSMAETAGAAGSPTYTTTYTYDTELHGKGLLALASGGENNSTILYKYDEFSRCYKILESIDGQNFINTMSFDDYGRKTKLTYTSGFEINYQFDAPSGELVRISDASNNSIWALTQTDHLGGVASSSLGTGGHFSRSVQKNDFGYTSSRTFNCSYSGYSWQNQWNYNYNVVNGDLDLRQNVVTKSGTWTGNNIQPRNNTEEFEYDILDRLKKIELTDGGIPSTKDIDYNNNGSISYMTDALGNNQKFNYNTSVPLHAIKSIETLYESWKPKQQITYTPFNKIKQITEGDENLNQNYTSLEFVYGLDNERRKSVEKYYVSSTLTKTKTKYYSGGYEKYIVEQGGVTTTRELNYIAAPDGLAAIIETSGASTNLYFVVSDNQGSVLMLTDVNGTIVEDLGYDAWGRRRNPVNWGYANININGITDLGYTSQEMMDAFSMINMNGRVYDPLVGQFISPDMMIQNPLNSQSYNSFSYCLNNPLKYSDPSGWTSFSYREFIDQGHWWANFYAEQLKNGDPLFQSTWQSKYNAALVKFAEYVGWQDKYNCFSSYYQYDKSVESYKEAALAYRSLYGMKFNIKFEILILKETSEIYCGRLSWTKTQEVESGTNTILFYTQVEIIDKYITNVYEHHWFEWVETRPSDHYMYDCADKLGYSFYKGVEFGILTVCGGEVIGVATDLIFAESAVEVAATEAATEAGVESVVEAAAETGTNVVEEVVVHGNSLKSLRPTWGYKLYSADGTTFLKNGITSAVKAESRYTKAFMSDKVMQVKILFPNRAAAYQWEYEQNLILRGPLNFNMH